MTPATKRKFHNPTPGWVGVTIFNAKREPQGVAVEPGGFVWLSDEEQQMTAEAPRLEQDNPFVKEWQRPTGEVNPTTGEQVTTTEHGMLRPTNDPPRPVFSDRFIPGAEEAASSAADEPPHTGAAPTPSAEPEQGQRAEEEIVATPEAVEARDATLAAREPADETPSATPAPVPPPRAPVSSS